MKKVLFILLVFTTLGVSAQPGFFFAQNKPGTGSNNLTEGLVAFWPLDESAGTTANDVSGNGHHGTANTTGIIGQTGVKATYAALFDGTSDRITLPNSSTLLPDDTNFTINAWIRRDAPGTQGPLNRVFTLVRTATSSLYGLGYSTSETAGFYTFNGTSNVYVYGTSTIPLSEGCMVTIVKEGSLHKVYFNGVLEGSTSYTPGYSLSADPAIIGNAGVDNYQLQGAVNWLSLYSKALTNEELTQLYNSGDGLSFPELGSSGPVLVAPAEPTSQEPQAPSDETFLASADYYVSNTGSDSNDGLTPQTAWASLSKVNSSTFSAGDTIAFEADGSWEGTLTVPNSGTSGNPIVFSAYGTGQKPKIYGSDVITGWTLHSGNIYKATYSASAIEQLFVDESEVPIARYPKTGYYDITAVNSSTNFTSTQISSGISYAGSTALIRTREWYLGNYAVTSSSGQSMSISAAPAYDLNVGEGFVLLNKLAFLTQAGEWCFDSSTNTVYLWMADGSNPSGHTVRVSSDAANVSVTSKNYVNIENLELAQSNDKGVNISGSTYVTIDNCVIGAPNYGVYGGSSSSNVTVKNSSISKASIRGIYFTGNSHLIEDNEITDIGLFANLRISGLGGQGGTAITTNYAGAGNCTIRYNKITNCGLNGISFFDAPSTTIEYNTIKNSCLTIQDGGAIYCFESSMGEDSDNSIIRYNIIDNVPGNLDGHTSTLLQGAGIYTDDRISNVTIEYNTISGISYYGLYLHNNQNITARYNTIFDASAGYRITPDFSATGNVVTNNIIVNRADGYSAFLGFLNPADAGIVNLNSNTYVDHHRTNSFKRMDTYTPIDFTTWKSVTGEDALSTYDGTALGAGEVEELFYNDTKAAKDFTLTGSYRDLDGNAVSSPLTLQPFTSKILIKE